MSGTGSVTAARPGPGMAMAGSGKSDRPSEPGAAVACGRIHPAQRAKGEARNQTNVPKRAHHRSSPGTLRAGSHAEERVQCRRREPHGEGLRAPFLPCSSGVPRTRASCCSAVRQKIRCCAAVRTRLFRAGPTSSVTLDKLGMPVKLRGRAGCPRRGTAQCIWASLALRDCKPHGVRERNGAECDRLSARQAGPLGHGPSGRGWERSCVCPTPRCRCSRSLQHRFGLKRRLYRPTTLSSLGTPGWREGHDAQRVPGGG